MGQSIRYPVESEGRFEPLERKAYLDNLLAPKKWQGNIMAICEDRLGRELTIRERKFILSHGGFMALEVIEDSVSEGSSDQIERLLNSKAN